ncbi:hypothetical protein B0H14DRAFT_3455843 [Mycena olivaceomarginata]|nr:hypothetical protein B0H14DRAFT_3455843 [Mycena olivaceomarginata]
MRNGAGKSNGPRHKLTLWLVKYDLDRANGAILAKKATAGDTIEEDEEVEEVPAPRRQAKGGEG